MMFGLVSCSSSLFTDKFVWISFTFIFSCLLFFLGDRLGYSRKVLLFVPSILLGSVIGLNIAAAYSPVCDSRDQVIVGPPEGEREFTLNPSPDNPFTISKREISLNETVKVGVFNNASGEPTYNVSLSQCRNRLGDSVAKKFDAFIQMQVGSEEAETATLETPVTKGAFPYVCKIVAESKQEMFEKDVILRK